MTLNKKQLLELKDKVDQAKTKVAELTGQRKALMKQLKTDWGCTTIEEAEEKLDQLNEKIDSLETKIGKGITDLEEKLNPKE